MFRFAPRRRVKRSQRSHSLTLQRLEARALLAGDWRNPALPEDVDDSGYIDINDLLVVVHDLRTNGIPHPLSGPPPGAPPWLDVSSDDLVAVDDLLLVVTVLREGLSQDAPGAEAALADDTGAPGDGLTNNPRFTGRLTEHFSAETHVVARVDGGPWRRVTPGAGGDFDFLPDLQTNGVDDGPRQVELIAQTQGGPFTRVVTSFTLDTVAPTVTAALAHDSGANDTDFVTNDPTLAGIATDSRSVVTLTAQVPGRNPVDVAHDGAGAFSFDPELPRDGSADGSRFITLTAEDAAGNVRAVSVTFTLDTVASPPAFLRLSEDTDTGVSASDGLTRQTAPTVEGNAESGARVRLLVNGTEVGQATAAAPWRIPTGVLDEGQHIATATAEDQAGNVSIASAPLTITIDATAPDLNIASPASGGTLNTGARLTGQVADGGSRVVEVSYDIDGLLSRTASFDDATGAFDQLLSLGGFNDGPHAITLSAADAAGNVAQTVRHVSLD